MNRRYLLLNGLKAAGVVALAASVRPFASAREYRVTAIVEGTKIHPAIQADIDYWMKACPKWLAECPPRHVSYYAVKESSELRVYAVKWNGANLNDHVLSVPANEQELIAQAQEAITKASHPKQSMDIGNEIELSDGRKMSFCSYVYDSPLRRIKKWGGSLSTSLLVDFKYDGRS